MAEGGHGGGGRGEEVAGVEGAVTDEPPGGGVDVVAAAFGGDVDLGDVEAVFDFEFLEGVEGG